MLASSPLAAAFIDVSGVLNSCASASSTVARSSPLCRAASARAAASCAARPLQADRRQVRDRLQHGVAQAAPMIARLPIGAPPSLIADDDQP